MLIFWEDSVICVNTHLNASDQQTAKMSAFIKVITLGGDQLSSFDYQYLAATYPLSAKAEPHDTVLKTTAIIWDYFGLHPIFKHTIIKVLFSIPF